MKVVCDTNVLVRAACRPSGPARRLVEILTADHTLVSSQPLIDELAEVLGYPRIRSMFKAPVEEVFEFVGSVWSVATIVELPTSTTTSFWRPPSPFMPIGWRRSIGICAILLSSRIAALRESAS